MLPFLKNKEGAASYEPSKIERDPDGEESYDMLDAISEDFLHAVSKRDKALLRETLQALCEYVRGEDEEQDTEEM